MRFSVRVWSQNALFCRVRFSSPAQTWRRLTEKRSLQPGLHGKAHSATWASRKSAFYASNLTEKRSLRPGPHGEEHSARQTSRKSALCQPLPHGKAHPARRASRKSALWPRPRDVPHGKAHSGWGVTFRMRFYVRCLTKRRTLAVLELAECVFT